MLTTSAGSRDHNAMLSYHEKTKHSIESVSRNARMLDFSNMPIPWKIYRDLPVIPLPKRTVAPETPADAAILGAVESPRSAIDLAALAEWLRFSAGITKTKRFPGGKIDFRAASCTGALYHIDLYFACADLPDLTAGLYHYAPHDDSLRRLRAGDVRGALVDAVAGESTAAAAPVIFACADTFWRNSWKYEARAYRHSGWDTGTILANLLALANHLGVPANLLTGFVDAPVNHLLGLDGTREAAVALVAAGFGAGGAIAPHEPPPIEPIHLATEPLSLREIPEPLIAEMHTASSFMTSEETLQWREARLARAPRRTAARTTVFRPIGAGIRPIASLGEAILRRGSTREFARESIAFEDLSAILRAAAAPIPADFREIEVGWNDLYLIVNAVDGMEAGAWHYDAERKSLELLRAGDFRREAREMGLGQDLAGDASVNIYFLADLEAIGSAFGNRGYRAAQLEAGIMGGRVYLAAYARGLGATGLTFLDDDVTRFFSPHAADQSVIFLTLIGRSAWRRSP